MIMIVSGSNEPKAINNGVGPYTLSRDPCMDHKMLVMMIILFVYL